MILILIFEFTVQGYSGVVGFEEGWGGALLELTGGLGVKCGHRKIAQEPDFSIYTTCSNTATTIPPAEGKILPTQLVTVAV